MTDGDDCNIPIAFLKIQSGVHLNIISRLDKQNDAVTGQKLSAGKG